MSKTEFGELGNMEGWRLFPQKLRNCFPTNYFRIVIKMTDFSLSGIGHVSQVLSHSVMCWEPKNGAKDVTSDNLPGARHHIAFSLFVLNV